MSLISCGSGLGPQHLRPGAAPNSAAPVASVAGLCAGGGWSRRSCRGVWLALGLVLAASHASAAPKACEALKAEIEAKIQAQGVTSYTLEIISAEEAKSRDPAMIVGSCNFGRMKIIYQKNDR